MLLKKIIFKLFIIFTLCIIPVSLLSSGAIRVLRSLGYGSAELKVLRQDMRDTILTVKSRRPVENLPELRFYQYTLKKKDNFWTVLARTGLNMDTLISVNNLSSPKDIVPGRTIFVPNMRGVVLSNSNRQKVMKILRKEKVNPKYVYRINKSKNFNKKHLFIPCGRISRLQRSLFLGTAFMFPIKKGKKTSGFGSRRNPFNHKKYEFHSGVDLACPVWTKVYAARSGRVIFSGYNGGYGKLVVIKHEYHYNTYYGHLQKWIVKPGQYVRAGQLIAYSGNTGRTTGPHLHFEVRKGKKPVNPGTLIHR